MKYFYSHIIDFETLITSLEELDLEDHHKAHLADLASSTIHSTVLELVLSQLSEKDKLLFVKMVQSDPGDEKIMEFLNSRVDKIEAKIFDVVQQLQKELHEDIKEAKRSK